MQKQEIVFFLLCSLMGGAQEKDQMDLGPYIQQMGTKDTAICWSNLVRATTFTDKDGCPRNIGEYQHQKIHLANLEPNTVYRYEALNDGSYEGKATLATCPNVIIPFNFAVTGDLGNSHELHAKIVANRQPIGDREAFFGVNKELMRNTPYYPVLGKQEKDAPYYYALFCLPNNEKHYYFTVGEALFIVLDSEFKHILEPDFVLKKKGDAFWQNARSHYFNTRLKWLEKVLELNKEAGFVFQHKPLYPAVKNGWAEAQGTREFWSEIPQRQMVQVFLNGHDHHCHHAANNGMYCIAPSGAGAPLNYIDFDLQETIKSG